MAKRWPDEQEADTRRHRGGKESEISKARNLHGTLWRRSDGHKRESGCADAFGQCCGGSGKGQKRGKPVCSPLGLMPSGPGSPASTAMAHGGMPGPNTCFRHCPYDTSRNSDWSRWWVTTSISSVPLEPPYAEPHVRWCERAEGATPHPTRFCFTRYLRV